MFTNINGGAFRRIGRVGSGGAFRRVGRGRLGRRGGSVNPIARQIQENLERKWRVIIGAIATLKLRRPLIQRSIAPNTKNALPVKNIHPTFRTAYTVSRRFRDYVDRMADERRDLGEWDVDMMISYIKLDLDEIEAASGGGGDVAEISRGIGSMAPP